VRKNGNKNDALPGEKFQNFFTAPKTLLLAGETRENLSVLVVLKLFVPAQKRLTDSAKGAELRGTQTHREETRGSLRAHGHFDLI
jgi:hypothetical protein